jgi:hypothetical protein
MRRFTLVIGLMAFVSAPAVAAKSAGKESSKDKAFDAGYKAGKSIGEAHPGSPAAKKTIKMPEHRAKYYERGWRQGAYERYVTWLKKIGTPKRQIPTLDEVFEIRRTTTVVERAPVRESAPVQRGLGVPSGGRYNMTLPPGNLVRWTGMVYDRLSNGMYRIRNESGGGGGRPNPFDHGSVVSEEEMYKILVREGALKP